MCAKVAGEHVWHVHETTGEFFLVLEGELRIGLREPAGEREVVLREGQVHVVPRGTEHRPASPEGGAILMFEPSGTLSTGDSHDPIPAHVDSRPATCWAGPGPGSSGPGR